MKRIAWYLILPVLLLLVAGATEQASASKLSGAIWTTDASGNPVDQNIYPSKCSVYLNGGPKPGTGGKGLPPGDYYYQVTDPAGTVNLSELGGKAIGDRLVSVPPPPDPMAGRFENVQLCPYADTPNPGGEYKVWLTPVEAYEAAMLAGEGTFGFVGSWCKTDNFKVAPEPGPQTVGLRGVKYYDVDESGSLTPDDYPLNEWEIVVTDVNGAVITSVQTGPPPGGSGETDGAWLVTDLPAGTYRVYEVLQDGFRQTEPDPTGQPAPPDPSYGWGYYEVTLVEGETRSGLNFGNVSLGRGRIVVFKYRELYDWYGGNHNAYDAGIDMPMGGWQIQVEGPQGNPILVPPGYTCSDMSSPDWGFVAFEDLPLGRYVVREEDRGYLGWVCTEPGVDGMGVPLTYTVDLTPADPEAYLKFGNELPRCP